MTVLTRAAPARHAGALMHSLTEAVAVECLATAFLLIGVVGSGIMAERLCGGNIGLALFANAIATGGALVALILAFGPRSGAHMNPAVTLAAALTGVFERCGLGRLQKDLARQDPGLHLCMAYSGQPMGHPK